MLREEWRTMKLLLTGAFKYSEEQLNNLNSIGYEILFIQDERLPLEVEVSDIDAVVCNNLFQYNDIKDFKKLKFIQLTSAGMDRVPLNYINSKKIVLLNANGVYSVPMAEWAVLKILEIYKKSRKFYEAQSKCIWEKQRDLFELTNKNVAIIGFGDVGAEVAKRLIAFDANIIGVGRNNKQSNYISEYYHINDIDSVLKKSDIIILTIPLNNETRHLINAEKIAMMKENCILINISRGEIIEEEALIKSIKDQKFLGVALDVFEKEPLMSNSELWNIDRLIITPHNSFISEKTNTRLFEKIITNLNQFQRNQI